jgi:predicted TIM-barrel fold metal-dependent hydrolase
MAYAEGRLVHDADAHIVEPSDWLAEYAAPGVRERLQPLFQGTLVEQARAAHADAEYRARDADEIMLRKNWSATGSFLKEDRSLALDLLGFMSQLVFNTFCNQLLQRTEHAGDVDFACGMARAHNRAIVDFCAVDPRLLPVGYVPLADLDRASTMAAEALDQGCAALMIASACPPGHSPSHLGLDGVWRQAEDAGVPVVFHVGGGGSLLDPHYFDNGLPPVPDFHGGAENFRSVDYMAIPYPPMQTLATMIIDGVLHRFPALKVGVIEQGASWLPGWMRQLDSAQTAFAKNEERLQGLDRLSDYVHRQVRVTPYPHEDAGWIVEQSGDEICMFSSDWPHVEGGRNPLGRFDRSLERVSDAARERFYVTNFEDLMGPVLARRGATRPVGAPPAPAGQAT